MKKNDIQHSLIVVAEAVKKEDGSKSSYINIWMVNKD